MFYAVVYFLLSVIALALVSILLQYFKNRRLYKQAELFPGPKTIPIFGNAHLFVGSTEDILNKFKDIYDSYPSPLRVWLGDRLFIAVYDPEQLKTILLSPKAIEKDDLYKFARPWLGTGLFTAPASKWRVHRRLIMPAFNQKILQSFIEIFEKHSMILVQELEKHVNGKEFDVFKHISVCTLNTICESAMGVSTTSEIEKHNKYAHAAERVFQVIFHRMAKIWLHPDIFFKFTKMSRDMTEAVKFLHSVTNDVIQKKKKDLKAVGTEIEQTHWKPFLDLLMELSDNGKKFTDEELREEVDTMMIAGNDTTASVNSFVILMLASHPEIQEKAYQELYEIYGDHSPEDLPVTNEDLQKMDYLERVIKETMRLFPVGPVILRKAGDDLDIGGHTLPKGSSIVIVIMKIHRNEEHWLDPLKFNPDRFLPHETAKRHPYCYIPFSAGPRNCIGFKYAMMAMKVLIATILRKYVLIKDEITLIENIKLKVDVMLKPVDQITVRIEKRIPKLIRT
ncbi:cytochrome P450 4C1-like [Belonocnema kinseyi]|uniref:cytochrome P450 4C1-like n=1 Tax=Belonocnema kinseyi TaxID=2817044 RepID=UPI00143D51AE|nr:cytochrome P450 4C1-like [Belonocnema kinseyi]